ncbi:nucleotidyltransferase [Noviherbaspirillum sp.]|uniref:nucleotidyltransferase n=1 Tax=Noviherbaspirillum sp. TaxID=1926288 RepID=UPI002FDF9E8F
MQTTTSNQDHDIDPDTMDFYRRVLETLNESGVPFLVGGAYAFNHYTGVNRQTRDLDLFICRRDYERISAAVLPAGFETELTFPHWLGKIRFRDTYIDLIFSSGNAIAEVDDAWFDHATDAEVMGIPTKFCPVEEMIWSKAFIMERERFDGADVIHLLLTRAGEMDWQRLLERFEPHWRILLSHFILFGFIYPAHRNLIPTWIMDNLLERLEHEVHTDPPEIDICQGTLLSREQYLTDIHQQGLKDGRVIPFGNMTPKDTKRWTDAIAGDHDPN